MKGISLKIKLQLLTGTIIFVVILSLVMNSYFGQSAVLKEALENQVNANGEILASSVSAMVNFDDTDGMKKLFDNVFSDVDNITGVRVLKEGESDIFFEEYKKDEFKEDGASNQVHFKIIHEEDKNKTLIGNLTLFYTDIKVREELNKILLSNITIGTLIFLISILLISILFGKIKSRLETMIEISKNIANGQLGEAKKILIESFKEQKKDLISEESDIEMLFMKTDMKHQLKSKDELILVLSEYFSMVKSLSLLIARIQRAEESISKAADDIANRARELEATSIQQSASTLEITNTNEEVEATSTELFKNIDQIGEIIEETANMASDGKSNLIQMEDAMNQLILSTKSISSKLAVINSKTNKISSVGSTINTISDQTNLLSINASIEAEKAGEYGKGFLVISKEINHLANQTSVATQDIENMVNEMQSSVLSGVMEMDKFSGEVKKRVNEVESIGEALGVIITQVQDLLPEFSVIKDGMNAQKEASSHISESMTQLSDSTVQTKESISDFKAVTEKLNITVKNLEEEVSRFKIQ